MFDTYIFLFRVQNVGITGMIKISTHFVGGLQT